MPARLLPSGHAERAGGPDTGPPQAEPRATRYSDSPTSSSPEETFPRVPANLLQSTLA